MEENTIIITLEEYKEYISMQERIATVERLIATTGFVNVNDVATILNIKGVNL